MQADKFRIVLLDTKYRNPNHYICIALGSAFERNPDVEFVRKADPLDALSVAHEHRCNLFVAFDGEELDAILCERLSTLCGRSVLWVTEDPYEIDVNVRHSKLFDLVFTNDSASVDNYGPKGRHLPLAGATEFHDHAVIPADKPLRYELFFAGTAWPNRTAFVRSVLRDIPPNWRFKLALPTNEHLPPRDVDMPESMLSWRTSPVDFGRFVNHSAATVVLPRKFSASGTRDFAETPPPRLFEAALAGGAQLVHGSLAEVAHSFAPEQEILFFDTEREFIEKATVLVNDRPYRNRIAQAARERAFRDHTYDRRVATILEHSRLLTPAKPVEWRAGNEPAAADASGSKARKTLLFVCHNMVERGNFGGVEVYLDRMRTALREEFDVLFYVPGERGHHHEAHLLSHDYTVLKSVKFREGYSPVLMASAEREQAFYSILVDYQIDLVHFHHFIGHVPSLVYVAKGLGVPTAITAHDFLPLCNEFNLISFNGRFCGAPKVSLAQCDTCLLEKHSIPPGSQATRRNFWNGVLGATDVLVFNTAGTRDILSDVYPAVREHRGLKIVPVPIHDDVPRRTASGRPAGEIPTVRASQPTQADSTKSSGPATQVEQGRQGGRPILKVAILGNLTPEKGGDVLLHAFAGLADAPVEFHVFGRVNLGYEELTDTARYPNITLHGSYSADDIPEALSECEVSVHASIWPETYCLTLSEAWQQGIVPIVTDIGALGERVSHGVNGLKVRVQSEGDLIDAIRLLAEDRHLLAKLKSNITSGLYETLTAHVEALNAVYSPLLRSLPAQSTQHEPPKRLPVLKDYGIVLQSNAWTHQTVGRTRIPRWRPAGPRGGKAVRVYQFYKERGPVQTFKLFVKHGKRILWRR